MSDKEKKDEPSSLHWWAGALSGGSSVPLSWIVSGNKAAKKGIWGAVVGGLIGMNSLFSDDDDEKDEDDHR
jgi:hypothetical protein